MKNTKIQQLDGNIFTGNENVPKEQKTHSDVRQDKARWSSAREASGQPASLKKVMRAQSLNTGRFRSQNTPAPKRKAEQVTLWVNPIVKAELQRIAQAEGISLSQAGGAFLERALQEKIDMGYGALLQPIIEQAIARHMRSISTRLAWLLVRVAYDAGQTRSLVVNILGREPGMQPEALKTILEQSARSAKGNIGRRTPQLTELIEAVEKWMRENEEEDKHG